MTTENELIGLTFSAAELRRITGWPSPLIEDYLSIRDDIVTVSKIVDAKEDLLKNIVVVSTTPYTPSGEDVMFICDTSLIDIYVNLPAGIDGTNYRIVNFGDTGNKVYVTPNGTELLYGVNKVEYMINQESLTMTFKATYGWN